MSDYRYLIDNNALNRLTPQQRASDFFRQTCRIPSEVLHEAELFPDADALKENEYPTTRHVLEVLTKVMATVPTDDTKLVDLYANRGGADPYIIACALEGKRETEDRLFGPVWVIVSNDNAVRAKAIEFDIEVRTSSEFAVIIKDIPPMAT